MKSRNRNVTGKDLGAVALMFIWVGGSALVAKHNVIAGAALFICFVGYCLLSSWIDLKSKSDQQKAELVEAIDELDKHPIMRAANVVKWLAIAYIVYVVIASFGG